MKKNCSNPKCKQINPQDISQFYRNTNGKGGYRPRCVSCERVTRRNKEPKNKKPVGKQLFYSPEIIRLSKLYPATKVEYMGMFLGTIFNAGDGDFYVVSSIKGKCIVKSKAEGRQWLNRQLILCGRKAENNLVKKVR